MHGALVARPFDERRLQVSGEAVTLGEADGRFLINTVSDRSTGDVQPLTVFLNWREALKR